MFESKYIYSGSGFNFTNPSDIGKEMNKNHIEDLTKAGFMHYRQMDITTKIFYKEFIVKQSKSEDSICAIIYLMWLCDYNWEHAINALLWKLICQNN